MTDDLPTRPFTALPPPPAGAGAAVRGGHGIRRRRRLAGAGAAAASMVVVAGVLVAAGSGSPHAREQLVPAGPPTSSAPPSEDPSEVEDPSRIAGTAALPTPLSSVLPRATSTPSRGAPREAASPTARPATNTGGYRTPDLVRRYHAAPAQSGGPSGRICGGGGDGNTNGEINNGYGFCVAAYATRTSRGHNLVLEVCRDSTGPGSIRFTHEREAELVVHDVLDGDRVVWRWSTGHPNDEDPHALQIETSACWTWTAPWTDVDSRGRPLDTGKYEVAVKSAAQQLRGHPVQRAEFRIS